MGYEWRSCVCMEPRVLTVQHPKCKNLDEDQTNRLCYST